MKFYCLFYIYQTYKFIMIPFKKLASLFIRTFSKPLSNLMKRYALNNNNNRSQMKRVVRYMFISFGNRYN